MRNGNPGTARIARWAARVAVVTGTLACGAIPAWAEAPRSSGVKAVKFVPPDRGAPKTRVAAATRGRGMDGAYLTLLAPEQTGHTSVASPTLYWYISERFAGPVEVTLTDEEGIDPLLELRLDRGATAGVHAVPLAAHKVTLESGVDYQWSVTLVADPDQPSADTHASAAVRRVAVPAGSPKASSDADRLASLAAGGLWYDAIDLTGRLITARPEEPAWREARAALLEQQGLDEPAALDRKLVAGSQ